MKIIKSTIKVILLAAIISFSIVAISSTTRVSCEGNLEKSIDSEEDMVDKKSMKVNLTILFTNGKAILPGAVLSCLRNGNHSKKLCESRTLTQLRALELENGSLIYKYVDSVKQHTEIFTGYCRPNNHFRAQ